MMRTSSLPGGGLSFYGRTFDAVACGVDSPVKKTSTFARARSFVAWSRAPLTGALAVSTLLLVGLIVSDYGRNIACEWMRDWCKSR
jgi:hypothetical protein